MEAPSPATPSSVVFATASRARVLEFLMSAAARLGVAPIVKYTSLSLFADRFLPCLPSLKALGDGHIRDQHFTLRDFAEAELVFLEVLRFEIGALNSAFTFLEELLIQFRELSKLGDLVNMHTCMDIMDLLYETEKTSEFYSHPQPLAASILVAAYILTVHNQRWEFPLLPWVKFATSCSEEDIGRLVRKILEHILAPAVKWKRKRANLP